MRFECTIMRLIEGADEEDSSDSKSDMLEMPNPYRKGAHGRDARVDKDGAGHGGKDGVHHTEEYWKSPSGKTKADWVKEEEGLNRGHRASESFAVLNELVVVRPPVLEIPVSLFLLFPPSLPAYISTTSPPPYIHLLPFPTCHSSTSFLCYNFCNVLLYIWSLHLLTGLGPRTESVFEYFGTIWR
jgi:hypothetical protein